MKNHFLSAAAVALVLIGTAAARSDAQLWNKQAQQPPSLGQSIGNSHVTHIFTRLPGQRGGTPLLGVGNCDLEVRNPDIENNTKGYRSAHVYVSLICQQHSVTIGPMEARIYEDGYPVDFAQMTNTDAVGSANVQNFFTCRTGANHTFFGEGYVVISSYNVKYSGLVDSNSFAYTC